MRRILAIDSGGAGKSTVTSELHKILGLPIIRLDEHYWRPGWVRPDHAEWGGEVKELIQKDEWIMDGNYRGTLNIRLEKSDTVILFNFNRFLCLCSAFTRSLNKNQPFDKAIGNKNKLSWDLVKKIITFPKRDLGRKLETHKGTNKIFIVRNRKEADELLKKLANPNLTPQSPLQSTRERKT